MKITRIRVFHCGRTMLVVFTQGSKILFRMRLTEKGVQSLLERLLPSALVFPPHK
jgi:hypothetical protein